MVYCGELLCFFLTLFHVIWYIFNLYIMRIELMSPEQPSFLFFLFYKEAI